MISLWHGLQQGPILDTFKQIVHEYNVENSSEVTLVDFDNYGRPVTQAFNLSDEEQPILVLAPEFQTSLMNKYLSEKKIVPIHEFLGPESLDEIAEIVKRTFGDLDGKLSCLPINPSCGVLFTNKDILEASGRDPNWAPKSFEELEEVCRDLQARGLTQNGWTSAWPAAYLVEIPAAQKDIPLVAPLNGKLGRGEYQLNKSWLISHFLDLRQLQKKGIYLYAGQTNEAKNPFLEKKVAFFIQGSTHHLGLQKEASFQIGAGAVPTLTRGHTGNKHAFPMGGAAIWVLNNEQTKKMAGEVRKFLTFLSGEAFQTRWHQETAYVPVRKSLPSLLERFYEGSPIHKAVVAQTIEAVCGNHSFGIHAPNYSEARKELFSLIEQILDPNTPDDQIETLLSNFDQKYST